MDQYTLTKSRTIQWIIIILVLVGMTGAYWYFQARAAVTLKTADKTGLVGYWSFEDGSGTKATDFSGNNNTGTLTNGPTWIDGKFGKAVNFDGVNDYGYATTGAGPTSETQTGWFKTSMAANGNPKSIIRHDGNMTGFQLSSISGVARCVVWPGGTAIMVNFAWNYNDDKWHFIACTFNSTSGTKVYIDNVLVATNSATGNLSAGVSTFRFGSNEGGGELYAGSLDDIRVYNRALSATEVTNLYTLGTATVNASQNTSLTNGLVGQWSFDGQDTVWTSSTAGTTTDTSGNGNTGTLTNMNQSTSPALGKIGQALSFDGTNDYINAGTNTALAIADNLTLSAWINPPSLHVTGHFSLKNVFLYRGDPSSSNINYLLQVESDTSISFKKRVGEEPIVTYTFTGTPSLTGRWSHVMLTVSSGSATLYVNGVMISAQAIAALGYQSGQALYIGTSIAGCGSSAEPCFNGKIDEVRIYNRALSATEVASLYALGTATVNASTNALNTNGLVGQWSFDGKDTPWSSSTAATTTDGSGNGNTGTLTNMNQSTSPVRGKIGQALNFDGVNDYVSIGTKSAYDVGIGQAMTLSSWIKAGTQSANNMFLWKAGSCIGWNIRLNATGEITWVLTTGNNGCTGYNVYVVSSTAKYSDSMWHHVVGVIDRPNLIMRLYIDGSSVGTPVTIDNTYSANTNPEMRIGTSWDNSTPFSGSIDEVRIYNRALSAEEIATLYNASR